jgi:hypothetical protein
VLVAKEDKIKMGLACPVNPGRVRILTYQGCYGKTGVKLGAKNK